jgi:hypothetical protein
MGEENSLPTVEESTEPPIRALRSGNDHGPPTTTGQQHHINVHEEGVPKSLSSAHTLTAAQVAKELDVDIQYVPLRLTVRSIALLADLSEVMASAPPKRNLAFGSMGLTRLKELKGYPCGRFS